MTNKNNETFSKVLEVSKSLGMDSKRIMAMTPLAFPDAKLVSAFVKVGALAVLDTTIDNEGSINALNILKRQKVTGFGIRIDVDSTCFEPTDLQDGIDYVVMSAHQPVTHWVDHVHVIAQAVSIREAENAIESGVSGLIIKGSESGGRIGEESSYILVQRVMERFPDLDIPVWVQGGIGFHSAAACIAGGSFGVVLDSQLALLNECRLPKETKSLIEKMDGSETKTIKGQRVFFRPDVAKLEEQFSDCEDISQEFGFCDPRENFLPLGQDAALASSIAEVASNAKGLVFQLKQAMTSHLRQAVAMSPLAPRSPMAESLGTEYPIVQGPMTRVSDNALFANAIANNGGLPFLALSLMDAVKARTLMEETNELLGDKPWGVGVLGFAPAEILDEHLSLIKEFNPDVVIIAGARPSQSHSLEEQGIQTFLHVPAPGLLDMFLKDGARRFIFEGQECGGHVGPRMSFPLWEQQIAQLLAFDNPEELHLLFAGGIHDERSAAMIAAMAAPLSARGAKIGVLMGSAYITTVEAVTTGAVVEKFQQRVIGLDETVLLETAPGHASRCLRTPFIDSFEAEKKRLTEEGKTSQEIWAELEALNVGRLRIASKGVIRDGDKLVTVDSADQHELGMYMIGQVAAMRNQTSTMADLHRSVSIDATEYLSQRLLDAGTETKSDADSETKIAIVGMACIYPGAEDLETFWSNILDGKDAIREVDAERWDINRYFEENAMGGDKTPSKWGGFIDEYPFDPLEYGIPPQSLAAIEPVQLLSLEVCKRALDDAGYGEREFDREMTSVIFGAEAGMDLSAAYNFRNCYPHYFGEMPNELDEVLPRLTEDSFPGILVNVIAGRIANRLDLGGVNYTVDAACASSLTSVEVASKELLSGSSDMVLAGGADFHNSINDYLMFSSVHALSPTGKCRSFDDQADGISLGEGVGVVVMKRLEDAEQDGDRVYAVLDGIAGSSDGKSLGLTAPRREGQVRALQRAYERAGVSPADIGLVEAHGTGTVVGDRTEMRTLTDVFNRGGSVPLSSALGSVKSQIGHTKCAAGIAGLIKVTKALYHKTLPPTQQIEKPNDYYCAESSPFMLNKTAQPWVSPQRSAAISAFGFGGTNFHAVMSEYKNDESAGAASGRILWPAELFIFRGENDNEAKQDAIALADYISGTAVHQLRHLAYSLSEKYNAESVSPVQVAFVAKDIVDLKKKLALVIKGEKNPQIQYRDTAMVDAISNGKVAFLFPGQGSQKPGMLSDLFITFPHLQDHLSMGQDWLDKLYPPTGYTQEDKSKQLEAIKDTRVAQPTLGMTGLAMFELLQSLGLCPDMAAGHSYGELVALSVAGVIDRHDILPLSHDRGKAILSAVDGEGDAGSMAAVSASAAVVSELLNAIDGVVVANQNSPTQTVIAGTTDAVDKAIESLSAEKLTVRKIPVACAFHSPVVANAEKNFSVRLRHLNLGEAAFPVYSNTTAAVYPEGSKAIKQRLAEHIVNPVKFADEVIAMHKDGARIFIEVGAGSVLTGLVDSTLAAEDHIAISTNRSGDEGVSPLLQALAQLAVLDVPMDLSALYQDRDVKTLDLAEAAPMLPPMTWMVNGFRAYPLTGNLPDHAMKPISAPLQVAAAPQMMSTTGADQTVHTFLQSMRETVQAQREVMLSMLGQPVAPVQLAPIASTADNSQGEVIDQGTSGGVESTVATKPKLDLKDTLLDIVSDRTGYPIDMLDLDLDLEADLSIDSIKRVEITGQLAGILGFKDQLGGSADNQLEQLAAQKTLRNIVSWLEEIVGVDDVVEHNESVSLQDVTATLLDVVSNRTGYPIDMLELDLDLEADLSIDSIKRLEITGELAESLGFRDQLGGDSDLRLEQLASLKTLNEIVVWVEDLIGKTVQTLQAPTDEHSDTDKPTAVVAEEATENVIELSRYVLSAQPAPDVIKGDNELAGRTFLITDDTLGIAELLAQRLKGHGAHVTIVSGDDSEVDALSKESPVFDGLIHLSTLAPNARVRDINNFFDLARSTLLNKASYLLVASGLGGAFGHFSQSDQLTPEGFGQGGGMAGMIKSVAKEWPEVRSHWVDLHLDEPIEELAAYLEIELLAENPLTEVGYVAGQRMSNDIVQAALLEARDSSTGSLNLTKDSVVLLTGGARGITAQLAISLATRYGCQLELVGRSPLPDTDESPDIAKAMDLRELRQALIKTEAGMSPVEIEKACTRILAAREISMTIAAIQASGARLNYHAVDVRDHEEFSQLINDIYEEHGRIDGVIHGAGILEDKLLRHKTADSFKRVFDTKVRGALSIAKNVRDDVSFVVFFSSVAATFGNRGQVDYAAANDALDKIAHSLQARLAGRVVSVNWGPWASEGMVSPELEREYNKRGIGLIPLQEGVEALLSELKYGEQQDTQVVLMCSTPEVMALA